MRQNPRCFSILEKQTSAGSKNTEQAYPTWGFVSLNVMNCFSGMISSDRTRVSRGSSDQQKWSRWVCKIKQIDFTSEPSRLSLQEGLGVFSIVNGVKTGVFSEDLVVAVGTLLLFLSRLDNPSCPLHPNFAADWKVQEALVNIDFGSSFMQPKQNSYWKKWSPVD